MRQNNRYRRLLEAVDHVEQRIARALVEDPKRATAHAEMYGQDARSRLAYLVGCYEQELRMIAGQLRGVVEQLEGGQTSLERQLRASIEHVAARKGAS